MNFYLGVGERRGMREEGEGGERRGEKRSENGKGRGVDEIGRVEQLNAYLLNGFQGRGWVFIPTEVGDSPGDVSEVTNLNNNNNNS